MRKRPSIALGFLVLIALGAVALASPFAQASGTWGRWQDAVFTAFSAVCVTGLTVVDIAATYSRVGQVILLVLVEIGCLGLMTCGTFLLIAVGRRLSLAREFSLRNAYGVAEIQGLRGLICWIVGSMLLFETLGAVAYWLRLHDVYLAVFYSIMSFCNAGFSILPGSLAAFADDPVLVVTSALLTIVGGIGFLVLYNLFTYKFARRTSGGRGRVSLHSKLVLRFTCYLLAVAFAAFLLAEWRGALDGLPFAKKLWVGFYQAVTPRTCGFCITPTEGLKPITRLVYEILMFIGGGPGSAAAGIKITTFAVLCYTLTAMCRGDTETIIRRKVIPVEIVRESLVILIALTSFAVFIAGALFVTESAALAAGTVSLDALVFEAISAVTTTGLSVGSTTASLSTAGRVVVIVAMFIGRLGALTVVMMIGDKETKRHIRYPSEEIVVG